MKLSVFILVLLSCFLPSNYAASPDVSNVRVSQRTGSKLVDIYYDVSDSDGGPLRVEVQVSSNGGRYYDVPAVTLDGAVGTNITPGTNKHVLWNAGVDWPGLFSDQMKVRVFAADNNTPAPPPGMVYVPPGPFQMGDNFAEGASNEGPVQIVTLSDYYIDMYETTTSVWNGIKSWALQNGYTGLNDESTDLEKPAAIDGWSHAIVWCNARSEKEGLTPVYYTTSAQTTPIRAVNQVTASDSLINSCVKWDANGYRLPTEAEWEKAARGGLTGNRYPWGNIADINMARYGASNSGDNRVNVGSYPPNGYGLYDVAGNAPEYVWDRYAAGYYTGMPASDPRGPDTGAARCVRGGRWSSQAEGVRCSIRDTTSWNYVYNAQYQYAQPTIRCVRNAPPLP